MSDTSPTPLFHLIITSYMAKINPIMGKVRGKVGGLVYASAGGENIVREKATSVANPNTDSQRNTRAKFKLMSQLSAVVRPVLAIKKQGLKSAGNIFVSKNFELATYSNEVASLNLNAVQLTQGILALPDFTANRAGGNYIEVALNEDAGETYDKVIYSAMLKADDGSLSLLDSKVAVAGQNGEFPAQLLYTDKAVVIYAYGMRENTDNAKTKFGNMTSPSAEKVAKLLTSTAISTSDVTLSKTKGLTMLIGEDEVSSDDVEHFVVSVSKSGNGSVSGGGRYAAGQIATLIATPDSEATFEGWHLNTVDGTKVSDNARYEFEVQDNITLVGKFLGGPVPTYNIQVSSADNTMGTVSGGGTKSEGASCTVIATPLEGYQFQAWKRGNVVVSTSASYTFTVSQDETLVAYFVEESEGLWDNVTMNGSAWDANQSKTTSDSFVIAGSNSSPDYDTIGLVKSNTKPQGFDNVTFESFVAASSSNDFTLNVNGLTTGTYWLVAADTNSQTGVHSAIDIFNYNVQVRGSDIE